MAGEIDKKLAEMGIVLTEAPLPAANYVPFVQAGNLVFVSGQIPLGTDGPIVGKVGVNVDVKAAQTSARICGIALLAQLRSACDGDLGRVRRVVKLTGFVNASPNFTDHPQVMNGCSDLMVAVFGDAGRHSRAAVGCGSLPFGVQVEVEGVFEIE